MTISLQLPREMLLQRYPKFRRSEMFVLEPGDLGTILLRGALTNLAENTSRASLVQHSGIPHALIDLLGTCEIPLGATEWRLERALSYIARNFWRSGLSASDVARQQRLSRRSLDEMFVRALGRTVAAEILEQRMARASAYLMDVSNHRRQIRDVAASVGFEHPPHFTRAFRKRFSLTPSAFRKGRLSSQQTLDKQR
ncbi:helix-turn-helix transcriptional regulator [Bradyrhizobium sp. CCBAU 53338]|uniref:helix-turn-helix transcriptional regulator n=1 Tax=Bradyrhizobium sp. CCBAU 53338 TaxID=1325111 RepID=UPI00188DAFAD|nr:helix-turn-helix transcriptional regulator [Bradyrhizobium sp. CCBAU 53338]